MRLMFVCMWIDKAGTIHERCIFDMGHLIELRANCANRNERFTFQTETY